MQRLQRLRSQLQSVCVILEALGAGKTPLTAAAESLAPRMAPCTGLLASRCGGGGWFASSAPPTALLHTSVTCSRALKSNTTTSSVRWQQQQQLQSSPRGVRCAAGGRSFSIASSGGSKEKSKWVCQECGAGEH
jgi:hypothetical protein